MQKEKILDLVIDLVKEIGLEQSNEILINPNQSTRLFGENLDSLEIVMLICELEERISDEFGIQIILADDRAMSQRTSPFRSIKTLVEYIDLLLSEQ